MSVDLSSVNAKLRRAEEHAQAVKDEVRAWMDTNPYSVSKEPNADFTRYSLILHVSKEPLLERWGLMIGDSIHCLRCVLDHLVYAIAIHESGQNPPPDADSLQFPIADSADNFARDSRRRLKPLSNPVRAVIESLQPYNRPHPDLPPLRRRLTGVESLQPRLYGRNPQSGGSKEDAMNLLNADTIQFDITVSIDTQGGLRFEKPVELNSPQPDIESVSMSGEGQLTCHLKVLAASENEAADKANLFANHLAGLLAYLYNVETKSVEVKSKQGSLSADAVLAKLMGPDSAEVLSRVIQRELPSPAPELLSMFRQARNEKSGAMRYLLLYRLLDYKRDLDAWIRAKKPNTAEVQDRNGKKVTIYTDLRNRIHARSKEILYPYSEITSRIGELEQLARQALDEVCQSQ